MANSSTGGPQKRNSVKAPLTFSAVLALIAGIATMIFATGGAEQELRIDLGLIAVGITFIASLLVSSLLLMTEKPNPEYLSQGSGIHRSSAKIPGGAGNVGKPAPGPASDDATAEPETPRPADPTA